MLVTDRLIHKMIEQKADGIILSPINSPEIVSVIDYCNGLHIPIITVNTDVKGSQRFCFIGQEGERAGRVGGRLMGEFLNGKGKSLYLQVTVMNNNIFL